MQPAIIRIAEPCVASQPEPRQNQISNFLRVLNVPKPGRMERFPASSLLSAAPARRSAAACARHHHVSQAQESLKRPLVNPDLLDVGKAQSGFAERRKAVSNSQASVGDHIATQIVPKPDRRQRQRGLNQRHEQNEGLDNGQGRSRGKMPHAVPRMGVITNRNYRRQKPVRDSGANDKADDNSRLPHSPERYLQSVISAPGPENPQRSWRAERRTGLRIDSKQAKQDAFGAVI